MHRLAAAIGMLMAIGFVLGCGSSSSSDTSTGETASAPLSKAQFIKQADAICTKVKKKREAAIAKWEKQSSGGAQGKEEQFREGLRKVVAPSLRDEMEELESLSPPEQDAAQVDRMIKRLSKISSILASDSKELPYSEASNYEREAVRYGLTACREP